MDFHTAYITCSDHSFTFLAWFLIEVRSTRMMVVGCIFRNICPWRLGLSFLICMNFEQDDFVSVESVHKIYEKSKGTTQHHVSKSSHSFWHFLIQSPFISPLIHVSETWTQFSVLCSFIHKRVVSLVSSIGLRICIWEYVVTVVLKHLRTKEFCQRWH